MIVNDSLMVANDVCGYDLNGVEGGGETKTRTSVLLTVRGLST